MFKTITLLVLIYVVSGGCNDSGPVTEKTNSERQKRLLFYDEDGNIVKTYTNPYLRNFPPNADNIPFFGSFLNPFFSFLHPLSPGLPNTYMIPVSEEVIQQVNNDPVFQNKLVCSPAKEPVVELNPLCTGRRSQIPSPMICNNFLNCWDGWAFEQECPSGLLFSNEGYCDYPQKVDCSNRRLKEDTQRKCNKDFETFRNELKCSEFFVCVNRILVSFQCPADLAFNSDLGVCDYPYRVNCSGSVFITNSLNSIKSPHSVESGHTVQTSSGTKTEITSNSGYSTRSWSSTHVAMSRQDAIRQLQLGRIAKLNTAY